MSDLIILNIPKIAGQSLQTAFAGQIECLSFSHGVSLPVTSNSSNKTRTVGKPNVEEFHITKYVDQATPLLNQNCCMGTNLGKVTVTIGQNNNTDKEPLNALVYTLQDTVISAVSIGGGGGGMPVETVSLNYSAIEWQFVVQDKNGAKAGNVPASWNVATNTTTVP